MTMIKLPKFITRFSERKNTSDVKNKETREKDVSSVQYGSGSVAASNYGVATLNISSAKQVQKRYTPSQVERILKNFLKNDEYKISIFSGVFNNLDKLDYENIEIHLKNLKTFMSMTSNSPSRIFENGYFSSKEGAEAFQLLENTFETKSKGLCYVPTMASALLSFDVDSVLKLQERNLINKTIINDSSYYKKIAKMSDEDYSIFQEKSNASIDATGLSFEELSLKLKDNLQGRLSEFYYDAFTKDYIHKGTVVPQLEMLNLLADVPLSFSGSDMFSILVGLSVDNIEACKNSVDLFKQRSDGSVSDLKTVLDVSNDKTKDILSELLKRKDIPLFKIVEYIEPREQFVNGEIPLQTILDNISNDAYIKTVNEIKNSTVDLTPKNTTPEKLDPHSIKPAALSLVHMTKYEPEDGMLLSTRDKLSGSRNSVHFTLNHAVTAHRGGSWDNFQYAIIMPYESTVTSNPEGKFIEGLPNDIYTNGSVKIPEGSIILKHNENLPSGEIKISNYSKIDGVQLIETSIPPHDVVPTVIEKMGYTHIQGDAPLGLFSYGKNNGEDLDAAVENYSAWKQFCDTQGIKPTRHTGSAGDIAEKIIENIGMLCVPNTWSKGKTDYRKQLLEYIEAIRPWQDMGYHISYDLDKLKSILLKSKTPNDAVELMKKELGFHPTVNYDYFSDCSFDISIDLYKTWHTASRDLSGIRKFIEDEMSYNF